ncbi:MAG: ankyrin repeat domain-containing protein [Candidatus Cardinium sp.]|uniref:ankyrin repeat domain-containing protein n=1 Tax=Candidatus Cardinium sp. TP TaxID=2961955 RepID=UPI0021AF1391|nr:ankyrin repeat domain-containing protein [Candidatus Cardinium sp. TP]MDN5246733.1 ankyrin repeat domain-containing protein [Candidatus Cardinium sp.]
MLNHSRVDPNVKDNHGRPALYYVILHSIRRSIELDTKEVCLFLDNPKVEVDLSEYLPLTLQSGEKGLRMALCLLEHSASHRFNVDELTFDSALRELIYMHGDQYGKCADFNTCMSKLIEKGADINGEADCKDEFPILHIIAEGQGRSVTMDAIPSGLLNHIIDMGAKLNCTSLQGFTPLHVAVSASNYEAINILLGNKDTDLYVKNEYGHSIFDCGLGRLKLEYNTPTDDLSIDTALAIVKAFLTTERFKLEKKQDIRDVFDTPVQLENKKDPIKYKLGRIKRLYRIPKDISKSLDPDLLPSRLPYY